MPKKCAVKNTFLSKIAESLQILRPDLRFRDRFCFFIGTNDVNDENKVTILTL